MKHGARSLLKRLFSGVRYLYLRLLRNPGSPEYLGRGMAVGLFVGFLIPIGAQTLIALFLAIVCRGSKILAITGTYVTNPVTVLFIYPIQFYIGSYLIFNPIQFHETSAKLRQLLNDPSWSAFKELGEQWVASFFAAGVLFGILAAAAGYFATVYVVTAHRKRRSARRLGLKKKTKSF